jgi:hypothetical protein
MAEDYAALYQSLIAQSSRPVHAHTKTPISILAKQNGSAPREASENAGGLSRRFAGLQRNGPELIVGAVVTFAAKTRHRRSTMGFGRGALLWLIGIPLPIILLLALFMHH